jgi:hypothetical protein
MMHGREKSDSVVVAGTGPRRVAEPPAKPSRAVRRERGDQAFRRVRVYEEREFEDGEYKTRPLETVSGMDVIPTALGNDRCPVSCGN